MSFTIRLSQDLTAVEAGATVPLSIELTNKGEESDRYEMQVEGLDPEWTASPEPTFTVGPHEVHSQKVFFKPPRASESLAGNYPFVVRVRSLESGDARTVQGVLQIKAFNHLSMEISPRKGYSSPMRQQNTFSVTLTNLGNTEHTLQLSGADPEEECNYEFATEQITVGPGQQKVVEVSVTTGKPGLVASSRLFGFVVTARSIQNPNIMATAQAQLEQRPVMSSGALVGIVLVLAVFFLWFAVRPQPPKVTLFVPDTNIVRGQAVHISWKAVNASSVTLEIWRQSGDQVTKKERYPDLPTEGTRDVTATDEDSLNIHATATNDNNRMGEARPIVVLVGAPPTVHQPEIKEFRASKQRIKLGESILFTFDYSADVNKLVLSPQSTNQILPPVKQMQIMPTEAGDVEYQLFAYNAEGGVANSKKIRIEIYQASEANIVTFAADPPTIQAPETKTTIRWSVENALKVQLDDGSGSGMKEVDAAGTMDVITDKSVKLKLIAADSKGVTTSKVLSIKYIPLPPTPPSTTAGNAPPPTTAGGTGGTATGGRQ